jgi:membrane protein DedA with SNARE-associated domain
MVLLSSDDGHGKESLAQRMIVPSWLDHAILIYGYWVILVAVALETMGVPFPGETSLLAGAIYAGTGGRLNIVLVIVAAAVGAIIGDNVGYSVGRYGGYPLLRRILRFVHLESRSEKTLAYTQRFFERHGDKTVFFGRFFSLLRLWTAFLAGVNRMPWRRFLPWNAAGGIIWAILYGLLGYYLGNNVSALNSVLSVLGIGGAVAVGVVVVAIIGVVIWQRRRANRQRLDALDTPDAPDHTENTRTRTERSTGEPAPEHVS